MLPLETPLIDCENLEIILATRWDAVLYGCGDIYCGVDIAPSSTCAIVAIYIRFI